MGAGKIQAVRFARPYVQAAFSLSLAREATALWAEAIRLLACVMENSHAALICTTPQCRADAHVKRLWQIFEVLCQKRIGLLSKNAVLLKENKRWLEEGAYVRQWLLLLAMRKKLVLLPLMTRLFDAECREHDNVQAVHITTAVALSRAQRQQIVAVLSDECGQAVSLSESIDVTLLGGARICIGDRVIDGSVKQRLRQLVSQFQINRRNASSS